MTKDDLTNHFPPYTQVSYHHGNQRCLKIRLYPTPDQLKMFVNTGGCRRFIYNKYVEAREQFYKDNIKVRNLTKDEKNNIYKVFKYMTESSLCEVFPFLKEVSSVALQQARRDY